MDLFVLTLLIIRSRSVWCSGWLAERSRLGCLSAARCLPTIHCVHWLCCFQSSHAHTLLHASSLLLCAARLRTHLRWLLRLRKVILSFFFSRLFLCFLCFYRAGSSGPLTRHLLLGCVVCTRCFLFLRVGRAPVASCRCPFVSNLCRYASLWWGFPRCSLLTSPFRQAPDLDAVLLSSSSAAAA
jgi:hypothetical protein